MSGELEKFMVLATEGELIIQDGESAVPFAEAGFGAQFNEYLRRGKEAVKKMYESQVKPQMEFLFQGREERSQVIQISDHWKQTRLGRKDLRN